MQFLLDHIASLRTKPHTVRRQVAFTYAGIITGVIALVWLTGSLATGAFAIRNPDDAAAQPAVSAAAPSDAGVAGAAAALPSAPAAPTIQIIDAATSSSAAHPEQTTIPV